MDQPRNPPPRDHRYVTLAVLVAFVIAMFAYTWWSRTPG